MTYDDNDLQKYDGRKLSERFKEPVLSLDFVKSYNFPENSHIKSIVRGGLSREVWNITPHTPFNKLGCCNIC